MALVWTCAARGSHANAGGRDNRLATAPRQGGRAPHGSHRPARALSQSCVRLIPRGLSPATPAANSRDSSAATPCRARRRRRRRTPAPRAPPRRSPAPAAPRGPAPTPGSPHNKSRTPYLFRRCPRSSRRRRPRSSSMPDPAAGAAASHLQVDWKSSFAVPLFFQYSSNHKSLVMDVRFQ